jgi:enoyl-CoA hydratase/carnithine racemase
MGISGHGGKNSLRIVTERTKMAMPETNIGLFPDVGGGWFLAHCCPGRVGDYLALTGETIGGADALYAGLADVQVESARLPALWEQLATEGVAALASLPSRDAMKSIAARAVLARFSGDIDSYFGAGEVPAILRALESSSSDWARHTAAVLRKRSPLMLFVVQEQLKRARGMTLAEDLRMERDMVHHCFWLRPGAASETVEGIRALVIDKDQQPKWNPARIEDVTPPMVGAFFESPWHAQEHPLRELA